MKQIHKENRPHKRARHVRRSHVGATGTSMSKGNLSLGPMGVGDWTGALAMVLAKAFSGSKGR